MIHLDFETRSPVDLKACGLDVYAKHPCTDILCMGYSVGDEEVKIWTPKDGAVESLIAKESNALPRFVSHNAAFEIAIWNEVGVKKYGFPPVRVEDFVCTMAMCYAMALPGSLEKAAAAVGIENGKDMTGNRLMLQLSQPRDEKDGRVIWWEDEEKFQHLYDYCRQDVRVERELYKRVLKLSESERQVWILNHQINQRGIQVDLNALNVALQIVKGEKARLDREMRRVTDFAVASCSASAQLTAWLRFKGVKTEGVAKAHILELLELNLARDVREALLLRQYAAKTSTAKIDSMLKGASHDGRVRGLTQYCGASTGRFAGRRLQIHNLPRPQISQTDIEKVFEIFGRVAARERC